MTAHWLQFSEADFDASLAPRSARTRQAEQASLFFVATPVSHPKRAAEPGQPPGQAGLFDADDYAAETEN